MKTYILNGHTPVQVSLDEWARWFGRNHDQRIIGQENVGSFYVSTVFIGTDQRMVSKGPPLLFETMVFRTSALDRSAPDFGEPVENNRYASWDDAEAGHKAAVKRCMETVRK